MNWRMKEPCSNCPFNKSGEGLKLRRSLRPGRWAEITRGLLGGGHFHCHKTTKETGEGSELMCAGAIRFQERRGVSSQMVRWMERLDWLSKSKQKSASGQS